MEQKIGELKELGFFDHLSSQRIQEITDKVQGENLHTYNELLYFFDDVYFPLLEYEENEKLESFYQTFVKKFVHISKNDFSPSNYYDTYKDYLDKKISKFEIGFTCGNQLFKEEITPEGFQTFMKIVRLINKGLSKQGIDKGFYVVFDMDMRWELIYLSSTQYQFLKEKEPDLFQE